MLSLIAALAVATATPAAVPDDNRAFVAYVAGACRSFVPQPDLKPANEAERGYFAAAWDAGRKEALNGPNVLTPAVCKRMLARAKADVK